MQVIKNMMGIKEVYTSFDKKSSGSGLANNNENIQLANELHKPIIETFNKRKV